MYLTPVTGADIFLFSRPDTESARIATLYQGDLLEYKGYTRGWTQVESAKGIGWVLSSMVMHVHNTPPPDFRLSWPTEHQTITQGFGLNPQWYSKFNLPGHEGLDIRAPMHSKIFACADGEVYAIDTTGNHPYGIHIRIKHDNGYKTIYAHLETVLVELGQKVTRKQYIGIADSTGNSSGSHLHLTLKKDGATLRGETNYPNDIIDPTPYMLYD
jgi:murein DD-endopeptidase MepM/ murein hydrolase activator NlpD